MSSDTQYAYAVSRIRAIEKKMLDNSKLDRMIDARTPEEALKVLLEADYGFSFSDTESVFEYEKLLKEESQKVYELLREISPEPEVFDLFLLKSDYHNVKVLLKGEFSGNLDESLLLDSGLLPLDNLKLMLKERKLASLPAIMGQAVEEAIDTYNRTSDPQVIDLILDKATYRQMLENVRASKSPFLGKLVEAMIDLANINAFLRVKGLNKSWDFLEKVLLVGGSIDHNLFFQNLQGSLEHFVSLLRYTPYTRVCEEGIENLESSNSLTSFEKLTDNYIMEYVKKTRYITLGLEPLVGYLIAKQTEIKNARIIMVGKINNISGEAIRERLREVYV